MAGRGQLCGELPCRTLGSRRQAHRRDIRHLATKTRDEVCTQNYVVAEDDSLRGLASNQEELARRILQLNAAMLGFEEQGHYPCYVQTKKDGPELKRSATQRCDDFYANVGDAIRTLREDIPLVFQKDLDYGIYREDVVLRDPRNAFCGINQYKRIFWSLRFHGKLFFRDIYVEVKRIWQLDERCIQLRWRVHAYPRLMWDSYGTFDGVSKFKLDRQGRIYEHELSNVIFRDPPLARLPLFGLVNLQPRVEPQALPPVSFCEGKEEAEHQLPPPPATHTMSPPNPVPVLSATPASLATTATRTFVEAALDGSIQLVEGLMARAVAARNEL